MTNEPEVMNDASGARLSTTVEIAYSRFMALVASIFLLTAGIWTAYVAVVGLLSGHIVAVAVGLVAAVVGGFVLLKFAGAVLHAWQHAGAVVTFDENGVTDIRKRQAFIPWSDIGQIKLGVGETAPYLCFGFRQPDRDREDAPRVFFLGRVFKRARALGDWNISLRLLACRNAEALRQARRLHQHAMRQQVVERNASNPNGWSGTL